MRHRVCRGIELKSFFASQFIELVSVSFKQFRVFRIYDLCAADVQAQHGTFVIEIFGITKQYNICHLPPEQYLCSLKNAVVAALRKNNALSFFMRSFKKFEFKHSGCNDIALCGFKFFLDPVNICMGTEKSHSQRDLSLAVWADSRWNLVDLHRGRVCITLDAQDRKGKVA